MVNQKKKKRKRKYRRKKIIRKIRRIINILLMLIAAVMLIILIGAFVFSKMNLLEKFQKQEIKNQKEELLDNQENTASDKEVSEEPVKSEEELLEEKIEEFLSEMTLEEKIYQLFVVTPEQLTDMKQVTAAGERTKEKLEQHPVGGIIYFSKNLVSMEQTEKMLSNIQQYAKEIEGVPLFLCIDEEGGRVARIANHQSFDVENVGAMGNVTDAEKAYECGNTIGSYLHELGFNVDFAPDADVITNSKNKVIGDRSFGTDPEIVTEFASAYSKGLQDNEVLSTFKHFPGHGATEADTHEGYAYTNKTYEELKQSELRPFAEAQDQKVDMIMAAHISVPNIVGDNTPCSLSYQMITEVLREDLQYDGMVITDALNMGAIVQKYNSAEAAVKALNAGVDLLLMPENLDQAYDGVYSAVQNGELKEERIDQSVRRILKAKFSIKD